MFINIPKKLVKANIGNKIIEKEGTGVMPTNEVSFPFIHVGVLANKLLYSAYYNFHYKQPFMLCIVLLNLMPNGDMRNGYVEMTLNFIR